MLALHSCDDSQLRVKNVEKKSKNCKIRKKSENFKTLYKNLEKYGSFCEFRTSTEKSAVLATQLPKRVKIHEEIEESLLRRLFTYVSSVMRQNAVCGDFLHGTPKCLLRMFPPWCVIFPLVEGIFAFVKQN